MSTNPNPNPYASPTTELSWIENGEAVEVELAWLPTRYLAAMIDNLITYGLCVGLFTVALPASLLPFRIAIIASLAGFVLLINVWLLVTRGQTLGKLTTRIQVVDYHDNRLLSVFRVFILRHNFLTPLVLMAFFFPGVANYFLWLAGILDAIPVLFDEKRCLHDYLVNSKVVKYDPHRSQDSRGSHIEQHDLFEDLESKPQVHWQLARLERRVSILLALAGQEGDREAAIQKLAPTGLTSKKYFEKTVTEIQTFVENTSDDRSKASAIDLLNQVKTVEKHL